MSYAQPSGPPQHLGPDGHEGAAPTLSAGFEQQPIRRDGAAPLIQEASATASEPQLAPSWREPQPPMTVVTAPLQRGPMPTAPPRAEMPRMPAAIPGFDGRYVSPPAVSMRRPERQIPTQPQRRPERQIPTQPQRRPERQI